MSLLSNHGYTMQIVCYYIASEDVCEIVDGYHRYTVMKTNRQIREQENSRMPVVVIEITFTFDRVLDDIDSIIEIN